MKLEWSRASLADLDRFAQFLNERHPRLARLIGREIVKRAQIISEHPQLGRSIDGHNDYREMVLPVMNGTYVFCYRIAGDRLVMLRVFHGREQRGL